MIHVDPEVEQAMREKAAANVPEEVPVKPPARPRPGPPPVKRNNHHTDPVDADRFLRTAKAVVVDNFNKHRDAERSSELGMDGVYIVWFAKTLGNWKAIVASPVVRGLLWEVTYTGHKKEIYLDVYKKLNNVTIPLAEVKP